MMRRRIIEWMRAVPAAVLAAVRRRPRRAGAVALVVVAALVAWPRLLPGVRQPIAFNHRKHTQDLKLPCEFCHQYVKTGAHPGLPGAEICGMCHQAPLGTSPEAAKVNALVTQGKPIVFLKTFRLPPYVFYTHRRHVGIANLACTNCHGGIALTTRPPARPLVRIRMQVCLDCHKRMGQTTDCVACHR